MADSNFDVIVIGAGIAGLTAAKDAARAGLATASIEALLFGGLVININELDPAPGGEQGSGTDLASNLMAEVSDLGVSNLAETVSGLTHEAGVLSVTTDVGTHRARAVIVASGARLKRLGVPGEMEFEHRGVAQCADCDGPMYKDEEVLVVGGGDSALQEALVLANYAKRVHLVHRGARFRAQQHLADAVAARGNITPVWNTVVEEVLGTKMVDKVRVRNLGDGQTNEIACTGFFAYPGLAPNSEFLPPDVQRDADGRVVTFESLQTSLSGVFAVGAVRSGCGGLLTDAIADAHTAAAAARAHIGK